MEKLEELKFDLNAKLEDFLSSIYLLRQIEFKNLRAGMNDYYAVRRFMLAHNAQFLYSHARFERILGIIIRFSIKNSEEIKAKYCSIFESHAEKSIKLTKGESTRSWKKYFNNPEKMIEDYNVLESKVGQKILLNLLFDIDFNQEDIASIHKTYTESRERRNLLAHRSVRPDVSYYSKLENYGLNKDYLVEKVFSPNMNIWPRTTSLIADHAKKQFGFIENQKENPIDLSVTTRYLFSRIDNLVLFLFIVLNHSKINSDRESFLNLFHDILRDIIFKGKSKQLSSLHAIRANYFLFSKVKNIKLTDIELADRVNLIIISYHIKNNNKKKNYDFEISLINSIKKDEHEHALFIKDLLVYYINCKRQKFFIRTKNYLKKNKSYKEDISNWLIFEKYKKTHKPLRDLLN